MARKTLAQLQQVSQLCFFLVEDALAVVICFPILRLNYCNSALYRGTLKDNSEISAGPEYNWLIPLQESNSNFVRFAVVTIGFQIHYGLSPIKLYLLWGPCYF